MTAPQQRAGGLDANARGILVLVAAVVVGFLLLLGTGSSGADSDAEAPAEPTVDVDLGENDTEGTDDSTPDEADTTTTSEPESTALQPGEITVVVLNGGGVAGAAGSTTQTLADAGYQMGAAGNAADSPNVETTVVHFAEGFEAEATAVASVLGRPSDVISAMPETSPGAGADTANVVVVLGQDVAPVGD